MRKKKGGRERVRGSLVEEGYGRGGGRNDRKSNEAQRSDAGRIV